MTQKQAENDPQEVFFTGNGAGALKRLAAKAVFRLKKDLRKWTSEANRDDIKLSERWLAILVSLLLWEIAPRLGLISRTFIPPFSEVILKGIEFYQSGKLMPHVMASIARSAGGFAVAL